ncbi:MAG: glycosyltransferase family 4 protein [Verrucomicrobiota bacterium]
MPEVMACTHGILDPASRFRVLQYVPYLEQAGWRVSHRPSRPPRPLGSDAVNPLLRRTYITLARLMQRVSRWRDIRDAPSFDVIFQNRDLLAGDVRWEQRLYRRNPRVVFDFDDAIFLGPKKHDHIRWICEHAAWVTAGSEYLAAFARQFTELVTVLPTVVDVGRYEVKDYGTPPAAVRVGWCGSDRSIRETLFPHLPMLARLQQRFGFEFVIVTRPRPTVPEHGLRWSYVEWSPATEGDLALHMDIGIMPLVDDEFQRGKCGAKLLQYMAAGLPSIASPVGSNTNIVRPGETGLLCGSEDEWARAVEALVRDPEARRRMGLAGRSRCEQHYALRVWLPVWLDILDRVASARMRFRRSA